MPTIRLTVEQAQEVARRVVAVQQAQNALDGALRLLTLGRLHPTAVLLDVNVDTGELTFSDEPRD